MDKALIVFVLFLLAFFLLRSSGGKRKKTWEELKSEVLAIANAYGLSDKERRSLLSRMRRNKKELVAMQDPVKYFLANVKIS